MQSSLIFGMTIAMLNLMGTCIVRIQSVRIYFVCTKRHPNLLKKSTINAFGARPRVRWAIFPFKTKQTRFSWSLVKGLIFFEETEKSIQDVIGDVWCPTRPNENVFSFQRTKPPVSMAVRRAKPALTGWIFLLRTKTKQLFCFVVMVRIALPENRFTNTKKKNHVRFWRNFPAKHNQGHTNLNRIKQKSFLLWHNPVDSTLVETVNQNIISIFLSNTFSVQ